MRKLFATFALTVFVFTGLCLTAQPAFAQRPFHYATRIAGAGARFTTLPADGRVVPGVVYTETFVGFEEQTSKDSGNVYQSRLASVYRFSFRYDAGGHVLSVADSSGYVVGPSFTTSLDTRLNSASVSAVIAMTTSMWNGVTQVYSYSTVRLVASWTGAGPVIRSRSGYRSHLLGSTVVGHNSASYRAANVIATLDGAALGRQTYGRIYENRSGGLAVCHTC
jgi:hypothetical protein